MSNLPPEQNSTNPDQSNSEPAESSEVPGNPISVNAISVNPISAGHLPIDAQAMALVALMIDGDLSVEEREELRGLFAANPALLKSYVEQAVYNALLRWRHAQASNRSGSQMPTTDEFIDAAQGTDQTFAVQGELTMRSLPGDSGSLLSLRAVTGAQIPGPQLQGPQLNGPQIGNQQNVYQLFVESRSKVRHSRWPLIAAFAVTGAIVAAAILCVPSLIYRPAEPRVPAVSIAFNTWNASGGKFRKQIESPEVALVPNGLTYPHLACSGGALKINSPDRQELWFDLDAAFVVPPDRNTIGSNAATPQAGGDRNSEIAWPRAQPMGSPGTTLYLSFLVHAENPVVGGFCGLSFFYGPDNQGETLFVGKANGLPGYSYVNFEAVKSQKRLLEAHPTSLSKSPIPLDSATHLIVTRIDFREGQDRFAIYFDPDPTKPEPDQPNKTDVGRIALDRIRLAAGPSKGQEQPPTIWYFDEIRLADRYSVVVPAAPKILNPKS